MAFTYAGWMHVRLVLNGKRAAVFVDNRAKPDLIANLAREPVAGYIALFAFDGVGRAVSPPPTPTSSFARDSFRTTSALSHRPLRGRLLLATGILVVLGLLVADGATYGLLRNSLVSRIDSQLIASTHGPFGRFGDVGPATPNGSGAHLPREYVEVLDQSGNVVVGRAVDFGAVDARPHLPEGLPGSTSYHGKSPYVLFTARATGADGRYRTIAVGGNFQISDGTVVSGTGIIAISLADVEATLHKLLLVELIVTLVVIAAAGGAAWWLIRVGLRWRPRATLPRGLAVAPAAMRHQPAPGRDARDHPG